MKSGLKGKLLALVLVFAFVLTACGGSGGSSGEKQKIVIYTSMYEDIIDMMQPVLAEQFPDYEIEFFQGGTGNIQTKVAGELEAGKLGADMLMVADPSYALELQAQGVLEPIKIDNPDSLAFEYDKDGYWYPVRISNMVLAFNPDKYSKDELPQSMKDFAENPDMKDYISMSNPLTSGTAMASVSSLLDKYGEDYFKALAANNVAVESGSVALTKLETGEAKEVMILEESVLAKREGEGSKLEVIYPTDGTIVVPSPIMSVKADKSANNNVEACKAITEWFLSEPGQELIVKGWMHSVLKDTKLVPFDAMSPAEIFANQMPVDWNATFTNREQIRNMFQQYVTIPES